MTRVAAYVAHNGPPPGRVDHVPLDVREVLPNALTTSGVHVVDVRGDHALTAEEALRSDPGRGGGPMSGPEVEAGARAFALTNVAWWARRLFDRVETELSLTLPPLRILVGSHETGLQRWGGGHYRLPAGRYSDLPESSPIDPTGEVHLGSGRTYVEYEGAPYLHAPGHNPAIVTHEVAHHVCRHVADFRYNRRRAPQDQTNLRTAVEEGTCDYLAAVMVGHPDIYGWHRSQIPVTDPRRRCLSAPWTMADFRGGNDADPHTDGAVWASALWEARSWASGAGHPPEAVDRMLLRGLARLGSTDVPSHGGRRQRKYFGTLLAAMLDTGTDTSLVDGVDRAMASRGIRPGWSNTRAREVARGCA
jgi:hypothetical protein